jgi:hypothetical protein
LPEDPVFYLTHRLCPTCDARVPASAVECPDCETKLTPVRRIDTVRVTLTLTCLFVLAGGALWGVTTSNVGGRDPQVVAPRDWWSSDSVGLAIDSALERGLGLADSAEGVDALVLLTGGRTEDCEPYDPRRNKPGPGARSGPVYMANQSDRGVLMTIYRPDGQGWSTIQRRLPPGRTTFLTTVDGKRVIARTDWGVQVNAYCVEPFERVAGWTGEHFTLTWAGSDADR